MKLYLHSHICLHDVPSEYFLTLLYDCNYDSEGNRIVGSCCRNLSCVMWCIVCVFYLKYYISHIKQGHCIVSTEQKICSSLRFVCVSFSLVDILFRATGISQQLYQGVRLSRILVTSFPPEDLNCKMLWSWYWELRKSSVFNCLNIVP